MSATIQIGQKVIDNQAIKIRNYSLFAHLTIEEEDELNQVHNFISAKKGDYIYYSGV